MGEEVFRPLHEGIGQKPETQKPTLPDVLLRAFVGEKPSTPKPQIAKPTHGPTPLPKP